MLTPNEVFKIVTMKNTRFFALLRMTTLLVVMFICDSQIANAQDAPQYKYYFLLMRTEGKGFTIEYESGAAFMDLPDTIFLTTKNGKPTLRSYKSYSDVFASLSAAGLEYVQTFDNPTTRFTYLMWRKKIR